MSEKKILGNYKEYVKKDKNEKQVKEKKIDIKKEEIEKRTRDK